MIPLGGNLGIQMCHGSQQFFLHDDAVSFSLITDVFNFFFQVLFILSVKNHCKIVSEHFFLVILGVLFLMQVFELPFCSCFRSGLIAMCLFDRVPSLYCHLWPWLTVVGDPIWTFSEMFLKTQQCVGHPSTVLLQLFFKSQP